MSKNKPCKKAHFTALYKAKKKQYKLDLAAYNSAHGTNLADKTKKKQPDQSKPFVIFSNERRQQMEMTHPGMNQKEVAKAITAEWRAMSHAEQQPYYQIRDRLLEAKAESELIENDNGDEDMGDDSTDIGNGDMVLEMDITEQ